MTLPSFVKGSSQNRPVRQSCKWFLIARRCLWIKEAQTSRYWFSFLAELNFSCWNHLIRKQRSKTASHIWFIISKSAFIHFQSVILTDFHLLNTIKVNQWLTASEFLPPLNDTVKTNCWRFRWKRNRFLQRRDVMNGLRWNITEWKWLDRASQGGALVRNAVSSSCSFMSDSETEEEDFHLNIISPSSCLCVPEGAGPSSVLQFSKRGEKDKEAASWWVRFFSKRS